MLDLIASIFVRILNFIFKFIPVEVSLWLGRTAGGLIFFFNKKRRLIAYANLKAAFAGERTPKELRKINKGVYVNIAQTFVEIICMTKVDKAYIDKYVKIIGREHMDRAVVSGKGAILLTGHYGNWELSSLTSALNDYPIMVLAREQKMKRLNALINRVRESKGCKVITKGFETKNLLRGLKKGDVIGMVSDQDAGKKGMFVNFFGRPTSSHTGSFVMAQKFGCEIILSFIVRTHGPYNELYLEAPYTIPADSGEEGIRKGLERYTDVLEKYVRAHPEQWLWPHKRWKSTPVRTVLVLNDGKAGHVNQSMAVAREIRKARTTQGYSLDDTKIVVVDVKYKSGFSRALLLAGSAIVNWRWQGRTGLMKKCLTPETYRALMSTYSEFVVSCGSGTAPVNAFMGIENNAKNVIIMKPTAPLGYGKFKLAIVPKHDRPPKRKNIVVTNLAPNLIDAQALDEQKEKLKAISGISGGKTMGLFVGGDNPDFALTPELIDKVIDGALKFAVEAGVSILATTSRRTSREVEDTMKKRLSGNANCKLLVIANEKNIDDAVGGILALSDIAIVSGESVSMVSEAISSGKKVVAFRLEKKSRAQTKHERIMNELEKEGLVVASDPGAVYDSLKSAATRDASSVVAEDRKNVYEAVRRLI